jgi:hypothetical protein
MIKRLLIASSMLLFVGCAALKEKNSSWDHEAPTNSSAKKSSTGASSAATKTSSTSTTTSVKSSIVVDEKDLQALEKMNKALEAYVLKNEEASFKSLCKDKRFDCFVDEKAYPKGKKKNLRKVPPYASGSKMGLKGEVRVQARYDFYP